MNTRKTLKTSVLASLFGGAALFLHACLLPVGDGDGLNRSGDPEEAFITLQSIMPIISQNCAGCHQGSTPQGGINLSSFDQAASAFFTASGESVPTTAAPNDVPLYRVVPGEPENSFFYQKISTNTPKDGARMPLGAPPLGNEQIELIRQWIEEGAYITAPEVTD